MNTGLTRCSCPSWADKSTVKKADAINKRIDELNAMGSDIPAKRKELLDQASTGAISGTDFVEALATLNRPEIQPLCAVETVRLFNMKLELMPEVSAAGQVEFEKLNAEADKHEGELLKSLEKFQTQRPAEKTAMLRSDTKLRELRAAANAARARAGDWMRPEDHAAKDGALMRIRIALGLPATTQGIR